MRDSDTSGEREHLRRVTTLRLRQMKEAGQKIVCLTAYDALIARIFDEVGVDVIIVGDSLGNVFQGHETTIPVTLEEMIYHTKAVVRGVRRALVVTDMPFMSYQISVEEAFRNAGRVMKEGGAGAVKLEGGERVVETVARMTAAGIPVMGHLGLTPQSIHQFGTYRVRGTEPKEAQQILRDAKLLEEAGAFAVVLEKIPAELAREVTRSLAIPTIGIGAGVHCDGQVLVYTDMLGLTVDFRPRFVRRYENLAERIRQVVAQYADDVRAQRFPSEEESY
ncbi:MAG: 3-methyl-2-oxobutanoate hydroxymethyltransferase [Candidatus Kapabacteria bacterium]|nr:3-methyl-2-oxobutanoate hydroxymethyltransferase [Candidatus Kapabacteria bacterium]MDW7997043.1 3-methyl-2-oxobutanoate hydroxymethyltransferase [Bacteroidota bacterium]MDW8226062.1 3-methyl-2-oxobutanoate hydroxymethyltransferase [Bacteroidota bacterium]